MVVVMSDHGHGPLAKYFAVNIWLLHNGYIRLKQDRSTRLKYALYRLGLTPDSIYRLALKLGVGDKFWRAKDDRTIEAKRRVKSFLFSWSDIDWSNTRAYSLGYGGPIYVNLKGREPQGSVEPGQEYDSLLERLIADLKMVKDPDSGEALLSEFYRGRDIYSGPYAYRGPDLVFLPRDESVSPLGHFEFNSRGWFRRTPRRTGTHRMDGILFLSGPGIRPGQMISGASIMDIAPTVLALLGVPVPQETDGRVLEAALSGELRDELNITFASTEGLQPELVPTMQMSPEEEEILVTRLRDLGYIA